MKQIKNMMATLFGMMSKAFSNKANGGKVIFAEQLPTSVKSFVMSNFPNQNIAFIEMKQNSNGTVYEISFSEGTEVCINDSGNWGTVDCKLESVPTAIVPENINSYIKNHFGNERILRIDKTNYGYHTLLSNATMLEFNQEGLAA